MCNELPFVSIIVLNYNGKKWFKECFESLEKLNYPKDKYEVVMGDNASTDDSVKYVKENFPWVRILQFDKNYGFCKGNNLCAKEAKGEYLVFLNNDTFVDKDWLNELVKGVLSEKNVISCACKMLTPNSELVDYAGGLISISGCGFYEGYLDADNKKYNNQKYTGFGCGAGVLIQKEFFIKTGGFDEYYFYTGEEMDLGFRVWTYGYKVLFVPSAILHHYRGKTGSMSGGVTPAAFFLVTRGKLYFVLKNFELQNVIFGLILQIIKSFGIMLYTLLNKNVYQVVPTINAFIFVIKDLEKIFIFRKNFQKNRKLSDNELYKKGIIKGIKTYIALTFNTLKTHKMVGEPLFDRKNSVSIKMEKGCEFVFVKTKNKSNNTK